MAQWQGVSLGHERPWAHSRTVKTNEQKLVFKPHLARPRGLSLDNVGLAVPRAHLGTSHKHML